MSTQFGAREKILQEIAKRQEQIEDEKLGFAPLVVFAEGTTTNSTAIGKFKKGAFYSMRPV